MTTIRRFLSTATVVAPLLLAACGGGEDAEPAALERPGEPAGTAEVTIERSRYDPEEVRVAPGTTVTFTNLDAAAHTVTADEDSALAFDSGDMGQGDEFAESFDEPGTYEYFCTVHPTMRASIVVE